MKKTPMQTQFFNQVVALLGTLFTLLLLLLLLAPLEGCTSLYERAKLRYAHQQADTAYSDVQFSIPRDTIYRVFKTDCTHFVERIKQGRATLTIVRQPTNTTIIANCDSAAATKKVATQINTAAWGTDPAYEQSWRTWRTIALVLMGLFAFLILLAIGAYKIFTTYQLSRKDGTTA